MRELEQALELNDPITAEQIRQAAAAAAKKPPSYEQLLDLRKHFAKDTQRVMVEDAAEAGTTFIGRRSHCSPRWNTRRSTRSH